ncbi:unnamed protein product [Coccothraustes coccothraustes]
MYRKGGALRVTLSGQPRSRAAGSHVTFGHRPECPLPEHSPGVAGHTCQSKGWRRSLTGGSAAVPTGPVQAWKRQLDACGGRCCAVPAGLLAAGRGRGGAIRSETEADTCFELFSSLLVPPNEMLKCLSSFRLGLKAQSCQL